jgi:hypothetical protein
MKKSTLFAPLLLILLALAISCKSAPPPAEAAPESRPAQAPAPSPNALRDVLNRVEEARKRAMDFESQSYFPSDWETVEAQYAEAKDMPGSSDSEIQQKTELLNKIAATYDELFNKAIPLYAQAREDEIISVREEVISSGFSSYFPEYLQRADKIALTALEQYEAKDYYKARDTAAAALAEYETLLVGAKVFLTRQEIINRGFAAYDQENFDKADEIAQTAIDKFDEGDKKAAVESAEEALLRYNIVLTNAWSAYADERRTSASSEREQALADRVNIAVREAFREADAMFNHAEESFKAGEYEEAAILFTESEALFAVARQNTAGKRQRAIETIRLAEEKIEGSAEAAIEAERIIEGGSR